MEDGTKGLTYTRQTPLMSHVLRCRKCFKSKAAISPKFCLLSEYRYNHRAPKKFL